MKPPPAHVFAAGASVVVAALVTAVTVTGQADGDARNVRQSRSTATPATAAQAPSPSAPAGAGPVAEPPEAPTSAPVIKENFPDPDVLRVGNVYYAYATNSRGNNTPVATAPSIDGPWTIRAADALPRLGRWARPGHTWAPEVVRRPDGVFVLYYTAESRESGDQCIGAATATSPGGPFQPEGERPLVCSERGDAIDAAFFRDADGSAHLLYRKDIGGSRPTAIFVRPLGPRWLNFVGPGTRILTWDGSDPVLVEAPALVRRGDKYVLFYSGGVFNSDKYRTRYAVASALGGPYRRAPRPLLDTESFGRKIRGPGGADVVTDPAGDHIVFHGIAEFLDGERVRRAMYVADLAWDGDRPVARGARRRYEAENGTVATGRVVSRPEASGNRAVRMRRGGQGGLEVRVLAPAAGGYTVRVTYRTVREGASGGRLMVRAADGTTGALSLRLSGGAPAKWRTVAVDVTLARGWNTLVVADPGAPIEIDHVEVS